MSAHSDLTCRIRVNVAGSCKMDPCGCDCHVDQLAHLTDEQLRDLVRELQTERDELQRRVTHYGWQIEYIRGQVRNW